MFMKLLSKLTGCSIILVKQGDLGILIPGNPEKVREMHMNMHKSDKHIAATLEQSFWLAVSMRSGVDDDFIMEQVEWMSALHERETGNKPYHVGRDDFPTIH